MHVDLAVRNAAHERIALEILDLVEIERAGDQTLKRARARAANQLEHALRRISAYLTLENLRNDAGRYQRQRNVLVMQLADLFERVRKRVVPDIVQQRRSAD